MLKNLSKSINFSESNLGLIQQAFVNIDFAFIDEIVDVNIKCQSLKNLIESVINLICPVKALKLKSNNDQFPWIDLELCVLRNKRDTQHSIFNVSKSPDDYQLFSQFKASYQKLNRQKMYDHFQQKRAKDFKSSSEFYNFYSAHINTKSQKSADRIESVIYDGKTLFDDKSIADAFGKFLTNIKSSSTEDLTDCSKIVSKSFDMIRYSILVNKKMLCCIFLILLLESWSKSVIALRKLVVIHLKIFVEKTGP